MKTSGLTGQALDWAVAKCEGVFNSSPHNEALYLETADYSPSTNWSQGGPIIEREKIRIIEPTGEAYIWSSYKINIDGPHFEGHGPTPLIAAMRCYVASRFGDEIEIPKELT